MTENLEPAADDGEIEITPEMIARVRRELWHWVDGDTVLDCVAERVIRAALGLPLNSPDAF